MEGVGTTYYIEAVTVSACPYSCIPFRGQPYTCTNGSDTTKGTVHYARRHCECTKTRTCLYLLQCCKTVPLHHVKCLLEHAIILLLILLMLSSLLQCQAQAKLPCVTEPL